MSAELIIAELEKLPYDRKMRMKGSDAWIICYNPEHANGHETSPSAKINLDETSPYFGRVFCFGCGLSHHWNQLAKQFKLNTLDTDYKSSGSKTTSFRAKKRRDAPESERTHTTFLWKERHEWRGIPGEYLTRIGTYMPKTKDALTDPVLIFPVTMWGEQMGTVRALLHDARRDSTGKKLEMSYINSPGDWIPRSLFGYEESRKKIYRGMPLWLVEGPRDVFKGQMAGVRINGLLGSTFGEERAELVRLLNPPVLLIATDDDVSGDKAAQFILDECGDFVPCVRVRFTGKNGKKSDMFDQSIERIQAINEKAIRKYGK